MRFNIVKMEILPELIDSTNSYYDLNGIFAEIDKLMLQFIWKFKVPKITKTILKKKDNHFLISKLTAKLK